jgi:hypothetical protein
MLRARGLVWEVNCYEKGCAVNRRTFLRAWGDVRDQIADRWPDLSCPLEAHNLMDGPGWVRGIDQILREHAV